MSTGAHEKNARADVFWRDRLSLMTREGGLFTFWQPAMRNGYFQWWHIDHGVFSVTVNDQPRRTRCFPLVSVEWWEHEVNVEVPRGE